MLERNSALGKKLTKEDEVDPILDEQGLHLLLEALHLLVVLVVGVVAAPQRSHQRRPMLQLQQLQLNMEQVAKYAKAVRPLSLGHINPEPLKPAVDLIISTGSSWHAGDSQQHRFLQQSMACRGPSRSAQGGSSVRTMVGVSEQ